MLQDRYSKWPHLSMARCLKYFKLWRPDGNSVILERLRSKISRFPRFVRDAGRNLMGILDKKRHLSYFKHPTLSGNDCTNVPLKSRTLRETILPITLFGFFVKHLLPSINNEHSVRTFVDSGTEHSSLLLNKIRLHPEHSFSFNVLKSWPTWQKKVSLASATRIPKSCRKLCILKKTAPVNAYHNGFNQTMICQKVEINPSHCEWVVAKLMAIFSCQQPFSHPQWNHMVGMNNLVFCECCSHV